MTSEEGPNAVGAISVYIGCNCVVRRDCEFGRCFSPQVDLEIFALSVCTRLPETRANFATIRRFSGFVGLPSTARPSRFHFRSSGAARWHTQQRAAGTARARLRVCLAIGVRLFCARLLPTYAQARASTQSCVGMRGARRSSRVLRAFVRARARERKGPIATPRRRCAGARYVVLTCCQVAI